MTRRSKLDKLFPKAKHWWQSASISARFNILVTSQPHRAEDLRKLGEKDWGKLTKKERLYITHRVKIKVLIK